MTQHESLGRTSGTRSLVPPSPSMDLFSRCRYATLPTAPTAKLAPTSCGVQ